MNRWERRAYAAQQRKQNKRIDRTTKGIQITLRALEELPLRMRLRTAWQLIIKHRSRLDRA